jgi:hypothetical protein
MKRDADDPFADEVIDFPGQRGLQAIGDVPRHFLVKANRLLAHRGIEVGGAPDRGMEHFLQQFTGPLTTSPRTALATAPRRRSRSWR